MERLSGDLDFVISARPAAAEATFEELNEEFLRSLRRFGRSDDGREAGSVS